MSLKKHLPLLRLFTCAFAFIVFIVSLCMKTWVVDEDNKRRWGLFQACGDNNTGWNNCTDIHPGDSPGYFEAVRVFACFGIVLFCFGFCACNENEGLGKGWKPTILFVITGLDHSIILVVMGTLYTEDNRWEHADVKLGSAYYICVAANVFTAFTTIIIAKMYMLKRKEEGKVQPRKAPLKKPKQPPKPLLTPKPQPHNTKSKKEDILPIPRPVGPPPPPQPQPSPLMPTPAPAPAQNSDGSPNDDKKQDATATPATDGGGVDGREGEQTGAGRFPILTLPRYDLQAEPESNVPDGPKDYSSVTVGEGTESPPPVALPQTSSWKSRTVRFVKNYAKAIVGITPGKK